MALSRNKQLIKIAKTLPYLPDLQFRTGNYRRVYQKAKHFYKNEWRGNEKPSPAFDGKIVKATNYGWNHVVGKTVTTNHKDATKRLNHLPNAKQIIEKSDSIYETIRELDKRGVFALRHSLIGKLEDGTVLRVIVKEVDHGLIFVTVYDPVKIKMDDKETRAKSS